MTKRHQIITIFVGSPSDVSAERNKLEQVVARLNREVSKSLGVTLKVIRWESDVIPGMGRPQSRVTPLVDECEIFIGILWHRFGSPPGLTEEDKSFESGTEEEFYRALERWQNNGGQLHSLPRILIYHSDRPLKPSLIKSAQIAKVNAFIQEFGPYGKHPGMFYRYCSVRDFETSIHQHLLQLAFELSGGIYRSEIVGDFVSIPSDEWFNYFTDSQFGYFMLMYGRTWRNTVLNPMRELLDRGGQLRFLFPFPRKDNPALPLMADQIGISSIDLIHRIKESCQEISELQTNHPGTIEMRFTTRYILHALYLFEHSGIIGLYSYDKNRAPSAALRLKRGSLHTQYLEEFAALFEQSKDNIL